MFITYCTSSFDLYWFDASSLLCCFCVTFFVLLIFSTIILDRPFHRILYHTYQNIQTMQYIYIYVYIHRVQYSVSQNCLAMVGATSNCTRMYIYYAWYCTGCADSSIPKIGDPASCHKKWMEESVCVWLFPNETV